MKRVFLTLTSIAVALAPASVSAQSFLDLYLGGAFTSDSDIDVRVSGTYLPSTPVEWDNSFAGGVRSGYWFQGQAKWIGLAGDISFFQADVKKANPIGLLSGPIPASGLVTFHLLPISPLVMLRLPLLTDGGFDNGRLQPYGAIGPAMVLSIVTSNAVEGGEVGFDVGLDARLGVTFLFTPRIGLFVEYRYTDVGVEITDSVNDIIKSSLQSNHINGGLALRF